MASRLRIGGTTKLRTNYAYNEANQLTHQNWYYRIADSSSSNLRYTIYSEEYTYNSLDGSLNTVKTPDGNTLDYDYDYHRRLSTIEGGPVETNYLYRHLSDEQTTTQVATLKKMYGSTTLSYGYTYGTRGNITKINDPISGTEDTFSYDDQKQLTRAVINGKTYTYTYDTAGNILSATENGETHTYQYKNSDWKDLLTVYDGVSLTYDTCGNPTKYHNGVTWNFTWENGRQLVSATTSGSTYTYTYTADGTRTGKTIGDTEHIYYYADGKLRREQRDGTNIDFFYDASGAPYTFRYLGDYYYYVTNLQGDVVRIVNSSGTVVATYKYDAWGNITSSTGTMASVNPLRYRGYYYDSETGFYYLMSRYYDPEIGRFINADGLVSTGQGLLGNNMFAYCNNNPILRSDFSGCSSVIPLPSLTDYYHMHKEVQYDIAEQYGYGIEVFVTGSKGIGRLDLYDGETNQYYEVKHEPAASGQLFDWQMEKYDASHVSGWRFFEYGATDNVTRGQAYLSGKTTYSYWDIYYHSYGDGVIVYNWKVNEKRYSQQLATAVAVAVVCVAGLSIGYSGGLSNEINPFISSVCVS